MSGRTWSDKVSHDAPGPGAYDAKYNHFFAVTKLFQ